MKILVTGGAGFIGSHIVDMAISEGMEVVVIDNLSTGSKKNLNPAASFYKLDIRNKDIIQVIRDASPDILCHQAAQVSVRNSVSDPGIDSDINITGTLNLFEACRENGVKKIVFASSGGAIYGEQEVFPAPESHSKRPLCPYGVAKLAVEKYLYFYGQTYGMRYVALRYANVYGPRQDPNGEAGVVAIFTGKMLNGHTPTINGDGGQTRDYVYVRDVARANLLAFRDGISGVYNVGTGIETSVNALYNLIKQKTGYTQGKTHGQAKAGEQYRSVLDNALSRDVLGWRPTVDVSTGLSETVAFFKNKASSFPTSVLK